MRPRLISTAVVMFDLFISVSLGFAQQYPYNIDTRPVRGIMPTADQIASPFDSIDPVSGKLRLEIPIASLPPGRGGSVFDLNLVYDSHLYNILPVEQEPNDLQILIPGQAAGNWLYGYNYFLEQEERYFRTTEQDCSRGEDVEYLQNHLRVFRLRITLPDGSQHILHLRGYGDELGNLYWQDGFYGIDATGRRGRCASNSTNYPHDISNGDLTYYTSDGSYLKLVIHGNASGNFSSSNTWTLYFPDGRQVRGAGLSGKEIIDANGNRIRFERICTENCTQFSVLIKDDFDRQIRIDKNVPGAPPGQRQDIITAPGPNGPISWTIRSMAFTVGSSNQPYTCVEWVYTPDNQDVHCNFSALQFWMLRSIQLPGAPAGDPPEPWNSFEFGYRDASVGGWGELSYMRTPGGAEYRYDYSVNGGIPTAEEVMSYDAVIHKSLVHDGEQLNWYFSYWPTSTTVTSPDNQHTVYHYFDTVDMTPRWNKGLIYQIDEPSGNVQRREWSQNRVWSLGGFSAFRNPNNPFVSKSSIDVANAIGVPSKSAITETMIDKNGNIRAERIYDWIDFSPGAIGTGGTLLRDTERTFYIDVPLATAAPNDPFAYWSDLSFPGCGSGVRRLNALWRQETRGTGGVEAVTELEYDCPFTSGNVTVEKRWDSAKSGAVPAPGGISEGNGVIFRRTYDATGNLTDFYEPAVRTHISYDGILGMPGPGPYPTTVEYAPGTSVSRSWTYSWNDAAGTLNWKRDNQNGLATSYTYDLYGRKTGVNESDVRKTQIIFDDQRRQVFTKQDLDMFGDGKLQNFTHYDQLGRIRLVRSSDGYSLNPDSESDGIKTSTYYVVSSMGPRVVSSSPYRGLNDATLEWTCIQKDLAGRVSKVGIFKGGDHPGDCNSTANRTALTVTDYASDYATSVDPAGNTRSQRTDGLGRLVQVIEDPFYWSYSTDYRYDANNNLIGVSQSDGGVTQTRTFEFSSLGRLQSASNPESGTTRFAYWDSGDLASRQDERGIVTSYDYDELHRLRMKSYSDGVTPNVSFSYYGADAPLPNIGQLQSVTSSISSVSYQNYDALGRSLGNTQTVGGASYAFQYTLRANGSLSSMQYPSGKILHYSSDDAGRVNKIEGGKIYADLTVSNDPFTPDGRIAQMKLGNELWETRTYRTPGTPTVLSLGVAPGSGDKIELEYNYPEQNNNGNLSSQVVRRGGRIWIQSYEYDRVNRISSASEVTNGFAGLSRTYDYDRFGNRWITSSTGITAADFHEPTAGSLFDRSTNRLAIQSYDANGNLTSYDPRFMEYDAENRLIRSASASNGNEFFRYDGNGRRVQKIWILSGGSPEITTYVYGPNGRVAAEYTNGAAASAGTSWVFADLLGSVRAVSGEKPPADSAPITECYDYLPFGRMLGSNDAGRNIGCFPAAPDYVLASSESEKFTGKERDVEIGLDYFGARYMSPAQGRFISPDPIMVMDQKIADPQQWNMYAYVRNNPLRLVDPNGKWPAEIHSAIIAAAFSRLTLTQTKILERASARVDGVFNGGQTSRNAVTHGMRSPNQSAEQARYETDRFISDQEGMASIATEFGHVTDFTLDKFGEALHAVTDRTSPKHNGEQVWNGVGESVKWYDTPLVMASKLAADIAAVFEHTDGEATITIEEYHRAIDEARKEYLKTFGQSLFYDATGCVQVAGCGYNDSKLPKNRIRGTR